MEAIIADKTVETTKRFIQDHIEYTHLSTVARERFIELYGIVNVSNAATIYNEVSTLYNNAVNDMHRELNMSMFKVAGTATVSGVAIYGVGRVLNYFNIIPNYADNFNWVAGSLVFGGVILFASVGH